MNPASALVVGDTAVKVKSGPIGPYKMRDYKWNEDTFLPDYTILLLDVPLTSSSVKVMVDLRAD